VRLKFLGATRQVTGSCYFIEAEGLRLLIDCGLYQERAFLERNWKKFPVPPDQIDFLLLTHVHLDHSGLIPKLVREGFSKQILTTAASKELLPIILLDSAHIQEEDAAFKKRRHKREGRKGRYPEIPLYTVQEAKRALPLVKNIPYGQLFHLSDHISVRFHDAGHILGSSMVELIIQENGKMKRIIFSGDIGQWNKPIIRDPSIFEQADYVVMESTYGNRNHEDPEDVETMLCDIINDTVRAGGNVIIPTFAVERAQELMFYLSRLIRQNRILYLMTFLDSPMAIDVTEAFEHHPECLDEETLRLFRNNQQPFRFPGLRLVNSTAESKAINSIKGSCIIMAGSGMCTGGRVKHHLIKNISRPESTIIFVGYQAAGTLGRQILEGRPQVRIHGQNHQVRARIAKLNSFSAHADKRGLLKWLSYFKSKPQRLFLTHGDKDVALNFADYLINKKGWDVIVPEYLQDWELE